MESLFLHQVSVRSFSGGWAGDEAASELPLLPAGRLVWMTPVWAEGGEVPKTVVEVVPEVEGQQAAKGQRSQSLGVKARLTHLLPEVGVLLPTDVHAQKSR